MNNPGRGLPFHVIAEEQASRRFDATEELSEFQFEHRGCDPTSMALARYKSEADEDVAR
jgi:hypothetical protein